MQTFKLLTGQDNFFGCLQMDSYVLHFLANKNNRTLYQYDHTLKHIADPSYAKF